VAHVLSWVYLFFLAFVPISVGVASIWSRRYGPGFWYTTALGLNWTLGVATYYLVPTLGPVFVFPGLFDSLPTTGVSDLQEVLIIERALVLWDADATSSVQSIAGFASLHVSIIFTAALIAHLLRLSRLITGALWTFLALTLLATIYFGWHYVLDDVAGIAIGAVSVYVGALATGQPLRRRPLRERPDHVVARDEGERQGVDAVEDSTVRSERTAGVLDARAPLEERLEQVADRGRDGHGEPRRGRLEALKRRLGQRREQPERSGAGGDAG
jgi:membrane-associated phospholipid phosphatase